MEKIRILLTPLLFLSVISFFLHLYISFFAKEFCFWNRGIIFGLMDFLNPYLLSFFLFSFLIFVICILWKPYLKYWEVFVVLGISSFGNILDRLVHGGVCDYIDIKIFFDFPIFNLNDIFISTALIIILFIVLHDAVFGKQTGE